MEWNHDAIQQIFREPSEAQGVGDGDGNGRLGIGMERTNQSTQGELVSWVSYRIPPEPVTLT